MHIRHFAGALLVLLIVCQNGVQAAESRKCPVGQHWVRQHHRRAYIRADGKRFSATTVKAHCNANQAGYDVWLPRLKDGLPSDWPRKGEAGKAWTDEERERALEALGFLPKELVPKQIEGVFRSVRSLDPSNPASNDSQGRIVIYDSIFDGNRNLSKILSHEFAHRFYAQMNEEDRKDYNYATGWINLGSDSQPDWSYSRRQGIETDSWTSPTEDFGNNVENFLFNPERLKAVSPNAYNWISKRFGAKFKLGKGSP